MFSISGAIDTAASTPLIVLPDMTDEDIDREWNAMVERSRSMSAFLDGNMPIDEYFDRLEADGIEIESYIDGWEENLEVIYQCA